VIASSVSGAVSSPSAAPEAPAASSTPTSEAVSVPVQSQIQGNSGAQTTVAPPPPPPPESTASLQQNQLPFDINTIALVSRVTVNLGRREAEPTQRKRGWW
jgi:hypothetical protein